MYLAPVRSGWTMQPAPLLSYMAGGVKQFEQHMLGRSLLYCKILWNAAAISAKGTAEIVHGMPEGYYKCLEQLPAFSGFHARHDFARLTNRMFHEIAADGDVIAPLKIACGPVHALLGVGGVDPPRGGRCHTRPRGR